jgi:hypothetical protein
MLCCKPTLFCFKIASLFYKKTRENQERTTCGSARANLMGRWIVKKKYIRYTTANCHGSHEKGDSNQRFKASKFDGDGFKP